jgi:hypothetical protein
MEQTGYAGVDQHTFVDAANGRTKPGQTQSTASGATGVGEAEVMRASPDNPVRLRGGYFTTDSRLTRLPEFDPRSLDFPMAEVLDEPGPFLAAMGAVAPEIPKQYKDRSYTWSIETRFDQGAQPSCVGHAWGQELVARPVVIQGITQPFCHWLYKTSQRYDAWAGEAYAGTSTLAGAKVLQKRPPAMNEGRGLIAEYRWIFGDMAELIRTLGYWGPVVAGSWWTMDMYEPDADGYIHPTGDDAGGHCYLINGNSMQRKAVRIANSWGTGWGEGGDAWMKWDEFEALIMREGELCVPIRRQLWG